MARNLFKHHVCNSIKNNSFKFFVSSSFVCYKTTVSFKRPAPFTDFLQDINQNEFLVKFANVPELQNAPEKIKKLFTLEYGTDQDKKEKKLCDLENEIDSQNRCRAQVHKIVETTFLIKEKQETFLNKRRKNEHLINEIIALANTRAQLMDKLRDSHFETYVKALSLLKLEHYFEPQYDIYATTLGDEVSDMRIRAFAESRRLSEIANRRINKLETLREKYRKELKSDQTNILNKTDNSV